MDTIRHISPSRSLRTARVLIADGHALARAGLRAMLAPEPDLVVAGEAADGAAAVRLCRELRPDLVIVELRLPVLDGIAATRAIRAESPAVAIIILTLLEKPDDLHAALQAGANGYLLKHASQRQLVAAVRQVLRGEDLPFPRLPGSLVERMPGAAVARHSDPSD
jgi:DNA-binding NarL/FixJ family response regulator